MNNDSLIEMPNEDNKWYEVDLVQIDKQQFSKKQLKCNLCFADLTEEKYSYSTLESQLVICAVCNASVAQLEVQNQQNTLTLFNTKFSNQLTIQIIDDGQFYNIQKGQCEICLEDNLILIKLNYCNHYCCNSCLSKYVQQNQYNPNILLCPFNGCSQQINDYLIIQYLSYEELKGWSKLIHTQFCFQRKCLARFTLQPYNNIQQNNTYLYNDEIHCHQCKKSFCKICWTQHQGNCNFEKLFDQYKKQNNIFACPNCNVLSFPNPCKGNNDICRDFKVKWQECQICYQQFCLDCKGKLELFESIHNNEALTCCRCKAKHYNVIYILIRCFEQCTFQMMAVIIVYLSVLAVAVFLACGFLIVVAIYISLYQLYQVSRWVIIYTKGKLQSLNNGILIAFSPLIAISLFVSILLIYVTGFIPLLVYNIRRYFNNDNHQ